MSTALLVRREVAAFIPELSLVAALDGSIAGHVAACGTSSTDAMDEIEAFDRTLEPREKLCDTPSRRHLLEIVARARPAEKSNGRCTGKFRLYRRFDENTISPCRQPEACPILHPRDSVPDRSELYLLNWALFSTNSGACQPRRTTGLRHCLHAMRRNLIGEHTK